MTELKCLEAYSDSDGNEVVFDGKIDTGIVIRFAGRNNKLIVKNGSRVSHTTFMFDCDDGICEIGVNTFRGTIRVGEKSRVVVGDAVSVVGPCYISTVEHASVVIGNDCMIGANNEIRADDAHPIFDVLTGARVNLPKSIRIGDHVWISTGAVVLGGSEIGDGSIIGHSSVVKGLIPNNCTAAGSPAKVLRRNVAWERPHLSLSRPHYKPRADAVQKSKYWNLTGDVKAAPLAQSSERPATEKVRTTVKANNDHPYASLPDRAFWRKSVGDRNPLTITDLYRKKFTIHPEDRITTAGSCFAQHIARKLASSGFNFCDYEPPPPLFPREEREKYNYGVYSARYCNIYTVRQLLQTFERAFGMRTPAESIWESPEGFYDAFRPMVEPRPFESEKDLLASRESHMAAVRDVFTKSDLFIFTLGLTEGWVSKLDGSVYPLCPGTAAGQFDPDRYEFVNFGFNDIYGDLDAFLGHLRGVNSAARVMLTVSPVPLVATKSDEHVMVATSYSKSVLRAVAGQLAHEHPFVDYFPSYEIISAPPMRGMFFEPNMRSVAPAGVDFVMRHFFAEHRPDGQVARAPAAERDAMAAEWRDEVCEEMLLDQGL